MTIVKLLCALGCVTVLSVGCLRESIDAVAAQPAAAQEKPAVVSAGMVGVAKASIDIDDPETCRACHGVIVDEWRESMHSMAHHERDPIYGAMRSLRMKKQGEQIAKECVQCHNPRAPDAPDSKAGLAGVSCAACHNIESIHREPGKVGTQAIVYAQGDILRSARDVAAGASPVHPTGPKLDVLADGETVCLACHDATQTRQGEPACTTGPEYTKRAATDKTCVSCHMPVKSGPVGAFGRQDEHVSHAFLGPHRAWYQNDVSILAAAVKLDAALTAAKLTISLQNLSAHGFPSGFPGRTALVQAVGKDADGQVVWRNFSGDPMVESPQAVLNKVYVDADGKPVSAPFSKALKRDSRLQTDETRILSYAVPETVVSVDVKLVYRLLPAKQATALGLASDAPEAQPRVIATVTAQR
jgi:hypothetical protein